MAKNPSLDSVLADNIIQKYQYSNASKIAPKSLTDILVNSAEKTIEFTTDIIEAHEVEDREQAENIKDSLDNIKEQMLVRDYNRQEIFLRDLELVEDDEHFGFMEQIVKNRLTKQTLDISFDSAGRLFLDYFKHKLSVPEINITEFSKSED